MQLINVGTNPNDNTGDNLRAGFIKVNGNFVEVTGLTSNLQSQINSMSGLNYLGSIVPTSPAYTGTSAAFWTATQAGTYTNFGSVVVSSNSFATISRNSGGTFSISQTPIDLSNVTFPMWSSITYSSGNKVSYLGKYWKTISGASSSDIPSISSNWIEDNNYTSKKVLTNLFDKNSITSGFYINSSGGFNADATYGTSDFIEVQPSTTYYSNVSIRFRCSFDINKTSIPADYSNSSTTAFTTSSTARYVRISALLTNVQPLDLRVNTPSGMLSPVPYEKTIPYTELNVDSVLVNPRTNLFNNTENLASGFYTSTNSTKGSDILNYRGINLTQLTGTSFYASLSTRFTSNTLASFIAGERYFASYYIMNLSGVEKFVWMRSMANSGSFGHEPKLIDGKVRRVWTMIEGVTSTTFKVLTNPTLEYSAQTATQELFWLFSASNFSSPDTQALNVRVGGFQIEQIDSNTYVNGVAMIGDSTMAGGAGSNDSLASREVSTYASGLLNVPFFNRAVGGEKTDTMDARWATDITPLAKNCKYVIIQGGVNDFGNSRPLDDVKASITSMYNKAIADGMIPILMTCTPSTGITTPNEINRVAFNLWLKNKYPLVMDIANLICDPANPAIINPIYANDGTHYGRDAKRAIANAIANWEFWDFKTPKPYQQVLSNWIPTIQKPFDRRIGDIKMIQGIDIFSNDNNLSLGGRYPLI